MSKHQLSWNSRRPSSTLGTICVASLILACMHGCSYPVSKSKTNDDSGVRARSMALLENHADTDKKGNQLNEAAEGFRQIAKESPQDPFGLHNLCIVLLSRIKLTDAVDLPDESAALCKEFESSIVSLRRLSANAPEVEIIASRYHQLKNERDLAIQCLKTAIQFPNVDADAYFQLIELLRADSDTAHESDIRILIHSAVKVAPNNLVISVAHLESLAKSADAAFLSEAERCRELFRPLISRTNSILLTLLDRAIEAFKKPDTKTAQTQIAFIKNLMLREIAYQNDRNQLDPHLLDYVRIRTNSTTVASNASRSKSNAVLATPKAIAFENSSPTFAIAVEDFDLDSHCDLIRSVQDQLQVWSLADGGVSVLLASTKSDIEIEGLALADLDRDYQFRKDELPDSALPSALPPDATTSDMAKWVDTDLDIIAYGKQGVRLFRNDLDADTKKRNLVSIELSKEMAILSEVTAVAVIDFDHDSDLDLVFASNQGVSLWSNRGDWTFADFTSYSQLPDTSQRFHSVLAMDLDRNVLNDFLLCGESTNLTFLDNNLHGRYKVRDVGWSNRMMPNPIAVDAIDANGDACWDLVLGGQRGTELITMKSVGRHGWNLDSVTKLSDRPIRGLTVSDIDWDGYADVVAWGKSGIEVMLGGSDGQLQSMSNGTKNAIDVQHASLADVDRDGDDDIVLLQADASLQWIENQSSNQNKHLEVVIRADEDGQQTPRERCNMHGVGSLIELKTAGVYQSRIVRGTRTKFGLGQNSSADVMRVLWTNGIPNNVLNIRDRATVYDQQNLGGSCPYLYAWNGQQFEFCTDCLWAAPIGLQFAQGVSAPTRDWEYLKLDGKSIQPKDGKYVLQITEELWEAAYFDAVQLFAIDHPIEVDVFTNEKVGSAELASHRIYTVQQRRIPKSVIDQNKRDWLSTVSNRDEQYTKAWTRGYSQGLVENHWLEIDLNESSESEGDVILFLTGWVFPSCTSLNVAVAENPQRPKLRPPYVQVPNAQGEWTEVIPYAGFPGGKTKTIAIDMTGKFLSNDRRMRLVTNMELCWDEVFWTLNETANRTDLYRLHSMQLTKADLHFRGFSELLRQPNNAPKKLVYGNAVRDSLWPPMTGPFTKYGQVTELVERADDLQVVMGAGDEMTIEFSAHTPSVPDGWTRDFVIYNVGWDKDADLNTVHGQDVEPLPFRAMTQYPYNPDESFPSFPQHLEFLKRYQTRFQSSGPFWNQIRDTQ